MSWEPFHKTPVFSSDLLTVSHTSAVVLIHKPHENEFFLFQLFFQNGCGRSVFTQSGSWFQLFDLKRTGVISQLRKLQFGPPSLRVCVVLLSRRALLVTALTWRPGRSRPSCPTGRCWPRAARPPWSWPSTTRSPRGWPTSTASTWPWATR